MMAIKEIARRMVTKGMTAKNSSNRVAIKEIPRRMKTKGQAAKNTENRVVSAKSKKWKSKPLNGSW